MFISPKRSSDDIIDFAKDLLETPIQEIDLSKLENNPNIKDYYIGIENDYTKLCIVYKKPRSQHNCVTLVKVSKPWAPRLGK